MIIECNKTLNQSIYNLTDCWLERCLWFKNLARSFLSRVWLLWATFLFSCSFAFVLCYIIPAVVAGFLPKLDFVQNSFRPRPVQKQSQIVNNMSLAFWIKWCNQMHALMCFTRSINQTTKQTRTRTRTNEACFVSSSSPFLFLTRLSISLFKIKNENRKLMSTSN